MRAQVVGFAVGFVALAAAFAVLARIAPARPGQPLRRAGFRVDLIYWVFTPLATKTLTRAAVAAAVAGLALLSGVPLDRTAIAAFASSRSFVGSQPAWLQALEVLVLADLIGYGTHRLFHGRRLWRFHAVHHSSTELDWLSSVRVHPVNDVVAKVAHVVPLFLLGFRGAILAGYVPFVALYALFLHANVSWTFGPLRYVIASPAFHRWHHTSEEEGCDKNFAGFFPAIDLAFGTFYMPPGRAPERFGIARGDVPAGFLAQLAYPFRRRAAGA
jgi:sterol desaturase/sphingolipid hydroxylase (fatty acid hydroxylase superfamily)